jgi:hypothetical protein
MDSSKIEPPKLKNLESTLFARNCFGSVSGNYPYEDVEIMAIIPSKI